MRHALLAFLLGTLAVHAEIVPAARKADWTVGHSVGVQGGIPWRSNQIDVTQAPYGADKGGVTNTISAIVAAMDAANAAGGGSYVYFPDGVYNITNGLSITKSNFTMRGESTNAILFGHVIWGQESSGSGGSITNGGAKGSTNFVLTSKTDGFGEVIVGGDMLLISVDPPQTNWNMPVISTSGYRSLVQQVATVKSITGLTVTISAPLVWDFTNGAAAPLNANGVGSLRPLKGVGLENLSFTMTNNGRKDVTVVMVNALRLMNCWITNCNFYESASAADGSGGNYLLSLDGVSHMTIIGSRFGPTTGAGTSHAGLIATRVGQSLIENNIFTGIPQVGMMWNEAFSGNAVFANYFLGNGGNGDILMHNTHPLMNLWEQNYIPLKYNIDGYFGSASHQYLFRNRLNGSIAFKRWVSNINAVGNVLGDTNYVYALYNETNGFTIYPIWELGFPNIGNVTYNGVATNGGTHFAFPGTSYNGFEGEPVTTGLTTITQATSLTNIIYGSFLEFPATAAPQNFSIRFQDIAGDTNIYYPVDGLGLLPTTAGGSSTSMTLNRTVWVTNGWKVFRAGPVAFQWLQPSNRPTHILHANRVYIRTQDSNRLSSFAATANGVVGIEYDSSISDTNPPESILYPAGRPGWWGTNRWPAYQFDQSVDTAPIPAQTRYNGLSNAGDPSTNAPSTPGSVVAVGSNLLVRLSWATSSYTTVFHVRYRTNSVASFLYTNFNLLLWTNAPLVNGHTNYYAVLASNDYGASAYSGEVSATPDVPPSTPTGLGGTAGNAQATLNWNASANATLYYLKRDGTVVTSTATLTYNNTGLNNGQAYLYSVAASNSYGLSAYSSEVSVTPTDGSSPVAARTGPGRAKGRWRR